ncbi:MAG: hypothetical protein ACTSPD_10160 [Promethearchaeota archaeon]
MAQKKPIDLNHDRIVPACNQNHPYTHIAGDREHVYCYKCKKIIGLKVIPFWQEELETKFVDYSYDGGIETEHFEFLKLYEKYIGKMDNWGCSEIESTKIKIKCKDGLIQIERIN